MPHKDKSSSKSASDNATQKRKFEKLTRQEIIDRLSRESGSYLAAREFTNGLFEELAAMIAENDKVKITRFGVFQCVDKKARAGRNPRTGEAAEVSARRVVKFKPSHHFRQRVLDDEQ